MLVSTRLVAKSISKRLGAVYIYLFLFFIYLFFASQHAKKFLFSMYFHANVNNKCAVYVV